MKKVEDIVRMFDYVENQKKEDYEMIFRRIRLSDVEISQLESLGFSVTPYWGRNGWFRWIKMLNIKKR